MHDSYTHEMVSAFGTERLGGWEEGVPGGCCAEGFSSPMVAAERYCGLCSLRLAASPSMRSARRLLNGASPSGTPPTLSSMTDRSVTSQEAPIRQLQPQDVNPASRLCGIKAGQGQILPTQPAVHHFAQKNRIS